MSKFQQRHYEALAEVFQEAKRFPPLELAAPEDVAIFLIGVLRAQHELSRMLERDSGKFDRSRFERACLPGNNVRKETP